MTGDDRPMVLFDVDHGAAGYAAGCRCSTCRAGNAERMRLYRDTGSTAPAPPPRGTGRRAGPNRRLVEPRPAWMTDAACRGLDPDMFVPVEQKGPGGDTRYPEARAVCARCPVRDGCLDYAIANRELFGIWGGMTPKERRVEAARRTRLATHAARRAERIAAAGVCQ